LQKVDIKEQKLDPTADLDPAYVMSVFTFKLDEGYISLLQSGPVRPLQPLLRFSVAHTAAAVFMRKNASMTVQASMQSLILEDRNTFASKMPFIISPSALDSNGLRSALNANTAAAAQAAAVQAQIAAQAAGKRVVPKSPIEEKSTSRTTREPARSGGMGGRSSQPHARRSPSRCNRRLSVPPFVVQSLLC
jgi:hypothetical protein